MVNNDLVVPPAPTADVTYTAQLVDGVPIWQPSQKELTAGTFVTATLVNPLDQTHHFQVDGVTNAVAVESGKTTSLKFSVPGGKRALAVYCPMHSTAGAGTQQSVNP
jgi:uncharacterized cupredoxin-like copper-binding protein